MKTMMVLWAWLWMCALPAWAGTVPAAVIVLPENQHAILVEKQTQRFYIFRNSQETGRLEPVFETDCSTGENPGPKEKEGDKKTPEGVYFLIDEYEEKYLTPIYGARAFPTDYPNFLDLHRGKTGYAIWIHGTDKVLKPRDTNGCIALENRDVAALSRYVTRHVTPVIIQETLAYAGALEVADRARTVRTFVDQWVQAHVFGTADQYLSFYAPGHQPDIRWWEAWETLRLPRHPGGEPVRIQTAGLGAYAHETTLVVVMEFALVLGDRRIGLGRRKLFVEDQGAFGLQIVGDLFQVLEKGIDASADPLVSAAQALHKLR
jgi:hypothetical protein